MYEFTLKLEPTAQQPIYQQIYHYIIQEIRCLRIKPNSKLPSIRRLSQHLAISRTTVEWAYHQLLAEGYIESRPKSGFYTKELPFDSIHPPHLSQQEEEISTVTAPTPQTLIDFRYGATDIRHFPVKEWRQITNLILQDPRSFHYGHPQGEISLRTELAKYLYFSRGVVCEPEQIVIGSGTQTLLSFLCQFINKEKHVGFEEPGYDGARALFHNHGFKIIPITLDDEGISISQLNESSCSIVYITPSHQFPMGMTLPITQRLQLIQWALEKDRLIIEDDYDGEFRYNELPIPALQGLMPDAPIIYMGTFSKSLLPGIRISYMVLPKALLPSYHNVCHLYEQTASTWHQLTLSEFMRTGYFERHIRRMRKANQKKYSLVIKEIDHWMKDRARILGSAAGMHILLELDDQRSETELIELAKKQGVNVYPTSRYWIKVLPSHRPTILLGYSNIKEEDIPVGIECLYRAWFE